MASSSSSAYDDLRASIADEGIDARVEVNQRALIDKVSFSSPLDRLGDETLSPDHMILRLSHSHRTRTRGYATRTNRAIEAFRIYIVNTEKFPQLPSA